MAFAVKKALKLSTCLRQIHVSAVQQDGLRKMIWNSSGFHKYGLLADDLMDETVPTIAEAVRRLPQKVVDERNYRMLRAFQCSIQKSILPKEQWTKYEDDVHYLQSYIQEVEAEVREREEWDRTH